MNKNDIKYPVKCVDCGREYLVGYKTYKRSTNHVCKRCSGLRRVDKLREGNRAYFNNPENKKIHSDKCRKIWENRPDEFKENRIKSLRLIGEEYRNSVDFPKVMSLRMKEYFKDPTHLENLSKKQKEHWDSMTYEWQYRSKIVHPDFKKIFPSNPITGGKLVNPYHIWDFIIHSDSGDILVDIDGSIHNTSPGKVTYDNVKIEFIDLIKFNDSQRMYQTDGLDAYVIRAYNNELKDDTEVVVLKDDSLISYKHLLSIIFASQLDKSEYNEITKCS